MDRKETAERIEIMQAFVDGKQIEFKDSMGRWCEAKNPLWNWDSKREYRIKPEPKYRPFKDAEWVLAGDIICRKLADIEMYEEACKYAADLNMDIMEKYMEA